MRGKEAFLSPGAPHTANRFLARLPDVDREALFPRLRSLELVQHAVLHEVGEPFKVIWFPHSGIVSLVVDLASGEMIEAGTVGRDGVVGAAAGFVGTIAVNRAVVQMGGTASAIAAEELRALVDRSHALRNRLFVCEDFLLAQAQQCAACNASHPVERRLARWLLRCRDVAYCDEIALTHEFVAEMLGVRRSSVTIVTTTLQRAGLIECRRGRIRLLDMHGLRATACECYEAINDVSERLLGYRPRGSR